MSEPVKISPIVGLGQENFTFEVTDYGVKGRTVKFEPNIAGVLRLGINAYGFGVGYSFRGSGKGADTQKGKSDFSDWQLGYHARNWSVEGYYQTYDGFYTSNTNAIQLYPDIGFKHFAVTGRIALGDEEFSLGGLMDQSEEITRTSGKYYLVGGIHQHEMLSKTSLLQQENAGINPEVENLRSLKAVSINFGVGAGKYWVSSSRYFVGALFDIVETYANYDITSTAGKSSNSDLTTSFDIKLAAGFSGTQFRTGLSLAGDITRLKATDGYINASANRVMIYLRQIF